MPAARSWATTSSARALRVENPLARRQGVGQPLLPRRQRVGPSCGPTVVRRGRAGGSRFRRCAPRGARADRPRRASAPATASPVASTFARRVVEPGAPASWPWWRRDRPTLGRSTVAVRVGHGIVDLRDDVAHGVVTGRVRGLAGELEMQPGVGVMGVAGFGAPTGRFGLELTDQTVEIHRVRGAGACRCRSSPSASAGHERH